MWLVRVSALHVDGRGRHSGALRSVDCRGCRDGEGCDHGLHARCLRRCSGELWAQLQNHFLQQRPTQNIGAQVLSDRGHRRFVEWVVNAAIGKRDGHELHGRSNRHDMCFAHHHL